MEGTESSCALSDAAARGTAWVESLMCIDISLSDILFKKQSPLMIQFMIQDILQIEKKFYR